MIQRRSKWTPPKAPSTRKKQRRQEAFALTPEDIRRRREWAEFMSTYHGNTIQRAKGQGLCDVDGETAVAFLKDFLALEESQRGGMILDLTKYRDMVKRHHLTDRDQNLLYLILLKHKRSQDDRIMGRKMIYTACAAGHEEAAIRILANALMGSKARRAVLRIPEIRLAREQLQQIAQRGENPRAMVLEGKIRYELGDEEHAIKWWEKALPLARREVEEMDRLLELGLEGRKKLMRMKMARREFGDLCAPWIELSAIHYERYSRFHARRDFRVALEEDKKVREAVGIGCELDDPTSHFFQAHWFGPNEQNVDEKYTSTWLFHMTKAAASGHSKACCKLAEWYAASQWPYIEDEPPDKIKPTPFDTYPAPGLLERSMSNVKRFLSFWSKSSTPYSASTSTNSGKQDPALVSPNSNKKDETNEDPSHPSHELFHTATFPPVPLNRFKLAAAWLAFPIARLYAPAYLLRAQMFTEKTLYGIAHVPASALHLKDSRYLYASKRDHDSGLEIPGRRAALEAERTARPNKPNPHYNPELAKKDLTQVFYAISAHKLRERLLEGRIAEAERGRGTKAEAGFVETEMVNAGNLPREVPEWVRKWLHFEDERQMYAGEVEELEREARAMAEAWGWDLVDEVGGLVYKSGLGQGQRQVGQVAGGETKARGYVGRSY